MASLTLYAPIKVTDTTVELDWSSDLTGTRTGYRVYIKTALAETYQNFTTSAGTVTGLKPSTAYSFQAVALFADGSQTARSNAVTVTTTGSVTPPPPSTASYPYQAPFTRGTANAAVDSVMTAKLQKGLAASGWKGPSFKAIIPAGSEDWDYALYEVDSSTPDCFDYTVKFVSYYTNLSFKVRMPNRAKPAQGFYKGVGDCVMNVWDKTRGIVVDFWQVRSIDTTNKIITASSGGWAPSPGDGLTKEGDANAARTSTFGGAMRPEDILAGKVAHACSAVMAYHDGTYRYPARKAPAGRNGGSSWLPLGSWIQLNMSAAEINALPAKPWQKVTLNMMREYGQFFTDTGGGSGWFVAGPKICSSMPYIALGKSDPWKTIAAQGSTSVTSAGTYFLLNNLGINWASKLRVLTY